MTPDPAPDPDPALARDSDPTRVANQAALTTSTGRSWLILGGLFAAIAVAILVPMTTLPPGGLALGALIAVVALYGVMVVARLTVAPGRRRLRLMAGGMLGIAAVSLVAITIVTVVTWRSV